MSLHIPVRICSLLSFVFFLVVVCASGRLLSLFFFFFFQAEDGIRDLVRSRGLGDVYKRQALGTTIHKHAVAMRLPGRSLLVTHARGVITRLVAVSYTHLTLPTSDLV